jgi:hypothetical protein
VTLPCGWQGACLTIFQNFSTPENTDVNYGSEVGAYFYPVGSSVKVGVWECTATALLPDHQGWLVGKGGVVLLP